MANPQFSIIIPVYNEENRIPKNIDEIFNFFKVRPESSEIIFVNDGSKDQTEKILKNYLNKYQFKIISYPENQGKGFAVRQGALAAAGDWVVFFDIDLATPLSAFDYLLKVKDGADVVIGSRRLDKSQIKKSESKIRTFLGHGFTKISNLLVPGVTDFTCGFKCFSARAVKIIFPRARINRWGFDTELLYIASLHKLKIVEMPVLWTHDSNSKVKVMNAVISSFKELVQMKTNQIKGLYK